MYCLFISLLGFSVIEGVDFGVDCKDIHVKHGGQCEQVYCDLDGKATINVISQDETWGFGISAISEDKDGIFEHLWWHLDIVNPVLKVGSVIESGDLLGTSGNTGRSTGAHLHRSLLPMARDTYGNLYKTQINNGYKGNIDPMDYFTNIFILDYLAGLQSQISILQKLINLFKLK